jgi:hypothetical protein
MTDQRSAHRAGSRTRKDSAQAIAGTAAMAASAVVSPPLSASSPNSGVARPADRDGQAQGNAACHTDPVRQEILAQRDLHRERREEHDAEDEGGNEQDRYVRRGHQQHQR